MMGRLTDDSKAGRESHDSRYSKNRTSPSFTTASLQNIPQFQNQRGLSFPPIGSRSQSTQLHSELLTFPGRSHSSFEASSSSLEPKSARSTPLPASQKLPPLPTNKSKSVFGSNMPPQSFTEIPPGEDRNAILDFKTAYENMVAGYFTPEIATSEMSSRINASQETQENNIGVYSNFPQPTTGHENIFMPNFPVSGSSFLKPNDADGQALNTRTVQNRKSMLKKSKAVIHHELQNDQHASLDAVSNTRSEHNKTLSGPSNVYSKNRIDQPESEPETQNYTSCSFSKVPLCPSKAAQTSYSSHLNKTQTTSIMSMPSILNDLTAFAASNEGNISMESPDLESIIRSSHASVTTSTTTMSCSTFSNPPYQTKTHSPFGRFPVLPSVMSNVSHTDGDNISLMSWSSLPGNAQSSSQAGMYPNPPFTANFHENIPSALTCSSWHSGRSSYSSRSRNKRALSNSPLSIEGIDLNTLIRMSPTSLVAYINGSRSSSSCVSPGSLGEKTGCYGHLSARNSSSSPNSGSNSSGNRRSSSYTPQTGTPGNSSSQVTASDNSNASITVHKPDFVNLEDNLLVMQAMQELESRVDHPTSDSTLFSSAQPMPEFENLHVLPQDLAAFATEDYIPFIPSILPPVHTHQPQADMKPLAYLKPPPPTYDQHMARKALLQQKSGSSSSGCSSSQPSNSSSFESSEGSSGGTVCGGGGSSDDSCRVTQYCCRWLDCAASFGDRDELVSHIEKSHVDPKRGEDFVCFWKLCPRRLHPFNARYKLLVHMRIHSGDKPNKCTFSGCTKAFSRLENLKIHLRSHTGERPYACAHPGCTKTFSNSSDRTKHQKTHQDTKPYVCQVAGCGKRYTDPSSLRKHVKKSHPEKKEPDRKKIRGAVDDLDPKDLSECLVVQAIQPSPPEPTDSGLGRSPSEYNPGHLYSCDTTHSSCHTSPSSRRSSPRSDGDLMPGQSLRASVLPPIVTTPMVQQTVLYQSPHAGDLLSPAAIFPSFSGRAPSRVQSGCSARATTGQSKSFTRLKSSCL